MNPNEKKKDEKKPKEQKLPEYTLPDLDPPKDRSGMETESMEAISANMAQIFLPGMKLPSKEESQRATQPLKAIEDDLNELTLPGLDTVDRSGMDTESMEAVSYEAAVKMNPSQAAHLTHLSVQMKKEQVAFLDKFVREINSLQNPKKPLDISAVMRACVDLLAKISLDKKNISSELELLERLRKNLK